MNFLFLTKLLVPLPETSIHTDSGISVLVRLKNNIF